MHELITRSLECFLRDTYGEEFWAKALKTVGLSASHVDFLFNATDLQIHDLVASAAELMQKPQEALLEDLGIYLVSHANSKRVRRLLRFSGETFEDFLHSLDDLPDRARLAVGDLILPDLELVEMSPGQYRVEVAPTMPGFASVLLGGLRALADDYGALVLLEPDWPEGELSRPVSHDPGADGDTEGEDAGAASNTRSEPYRIEIALLDRAFAEGKEFDLSSMFIEAPAAAQ